MGRLNGKVALVTGGARGIGAAIVRDFVKEGARVVFTDILEKEGNELAAELGKNTLFIRHDVTQEREWKAVIQLAEEAFGPLSILVNNAGIVIQKSLDDLTPEDFEKVYKVNQFGVYLGMRTSLPSLRKGKNPSIINISSISGMVGQAYTMAYNASKFAVRGMTKSAAVELGPEGIRVNSIHPGIIKTPMTMNDEIRETIEQMSEMIPLQKLGEPEEISSLCVYLASDESTYCTGSEFIADGGMIAQ